MILGIDFGASTTDAVLLQGRRIALKATAPRVIDSVKGLNSFLKKNSFNSFPIEKIAIAGGKSAFFNGKILGKQPVRVNEINAIGAGANFLSGANRCLAVSMGTGTCIVLFDKGNCRHVIGTGLGGGTILGLSKLLLKETNIEKLINLAKKGNLRNVDLSVRDIVGKGIGLLNADATAANFSKLENCSKADLAAGVQNMVAESVAVLSISAARQYDCSKIVFIGRTPEFPFVKKRLQAAAKCFGSKFTFPANAPFGTALGAARCLQGRLA
ncbi:MAG: hypothetical protein Q8N60_02550 [Candidatus Diapherotrites archaeon]|nr:hypothetical protein [Candidatus Diapherotrites archaeon]